MKYAYLVEVEAEPGAPKRLVQAELVTACEQAVRQPVEPGVIKAIRIIEAVDLGITVDIQPGITVQR